MSDIGKCPVHPSPGIRGISLRMHIAIQAMQGILSQPNSSSCDDVIASQAFDMADAMIAKLENPTTVKSPPVDQQVHETCPVCDSEERWSVESQSCRGCNYGYKT